MSAMIAHVKFICIFSFIGLFSMPFASPSGREERSIDLIGFVEDINQSIKRDISQLPSNHISRYTWEENCMRCREQQVLFDMIKVLNQLEDCFDYEKQNWNVVFNEATLFSWLTIFDRKIERLKMEIDCYTDASASSAFDKHVENLLANQPSIEGIVSPVERDVYVRAIAVAANIIQRKLFLCSLVGSSIERF